MNNCAKVGFHVPESRRCLADDLPALREAEVSRVRDEYKAGAVQSKFGWASDGATAVANVEAACVKYVMIAAGSDGKPTYVVRQKCAVVHLLECPLTGIQLAASTNNNINLRLGNPTNESMRSFGIDRAAANLVGGRHLTADGTGTVDPWFGWTSCFINDCLSHSVVKIGDVIMTECQYVTVAYDAVKGALTNSSYTKIICATVLGINVNTGSDKTWHFTQNNCVEIFARRAPQATSFALALKGARTAAGNEVAPVCAAKLADIMFDPLAKRRVMMEAASLMDFGEPVVQATYIVESDNLGPIRRAYNLVNGLVERAGEAFFEPPMVAGTGIYLPNVQALSRRFTAWAQGVTGNAVGTPVPTESQEAEAICAFTSVPTGTRVLMKFGAVWHKGSLYDHVGPSPGHALSSRTRRSTT